MGTRLPKFFIAFLNMKLFPFFGVVFAAKDECLNGMENSSPEYGGTCWDSWKDFQDWAKNNCGGIDESCDGKILDEKCFKNPFDSIDIPKFGLEDYKEWEEDYVKDGAPSDISKLEGCEFLEDYDHWFDPDVYPEGMDCDFDITLNFDGSSVTEPKQTTKFYEAQDKSKCGNKEGYTGRGDLKDCYCDLPESSDWISINSDIEETHPRNPRTDRTTRDVEEMADDELGTLISAFKSKNKNTARVLKLAKNHANRNYWRMDCVYCVLMTRANESKNYTYYFEYVLQRYNEFVAALMYKTCEIHFQNEILESIRQEFECFRCSLETDKNFCNDENELCFEDEKDEKGECPTTSICSNGLSFPDPCEKCSNKKLIK